jgi:NTE family protein
VAVLSPFGGRSGTLPAGQFEGLRKQGSRVEVITPDADSLAAMGTNQMDPATRIPAARAGFAQGKATRVTFL